MDPVNIDIDLVRSLIADQFSQWSELPISPVQHQGHDNRTFRLGDDMSVRLPSADQYAAHVETEYVWLPRLVNDLPLPIPVPLAMGSASDAFPRPWMINQWIDGEAASLDRIDDLSQFASDLARFLNTLQSLDASKAPAPGPDNFFRGDSLSVYDAQTRACIHELGDVIDSSAATTIWEAATSTECHSAPVWIHGDVAVGNLLVKNGRLGAVIDFGQLAAGDPSCDITIAWTLFSGVSRERFCTELAVDEATWVRGRGWGLWKALLLLQGALPTDHDEAVTQKRIVDDILGE
jgi:aminoglycoside phosphotransferase (APT) family kinase protein